MKYLKKRASRRYKKTCRRSRSRSTRCRRSRRMRRNMMKGG